jgi:energy-coupling factor transporter ATP-binding protein EcfA2
LKQCFFRHLNGTLTPSSGQVPIKGEQITKKNLEEIGKFAGQVFQNSDDQDIMFWPTNLGLDAETSEYRVSSALKMPGTEHLHPPPDVSCDHLNLERCMEKSKISSTETCYEKVTDLYGVPDTHRCA